MLISFSSLYKGQVAKNFLWQMWLGKYRFSFKTKVPNLIAAMIIAYWWLTNKSPPRNCLPQPQRAISPKVMVFIFSDTRYWSVCMRVLSRVWPLETHGLQPTRLLSPWNFPGKNTGVGCHFLLKEIFWSQGLNPCLLRLLHIKAQITLSQLGIVWQPL